MNWSQLKSWMFCIPDYYHDMYINVLRPQIAEFNSNLSSFHPNLDISFKLSKFSTEMMDLYSSCVQDVFKVWQ